MEKRTELGRQPYAPEEKLALLSAFYGSGLPQARWCEENGVALNTLRKWLSREKKRNGGQPGQAWTPVEIVRQEEPRGLFVQAGKFSIVVEKGTDAELLTLVLKAVAGAC